MATAPYTSNLTQQLYYYVDRAYRDAGKDDDSLIHVRRVAYSTRYGRVDGGESLQRVALCHDIVEDGIAAYSTILGWGLSFDEVFAVAILNRNHIVALQTYAEYIQNISRQYEMSAVGGELAIKVKILDLLDHLHAASVGGIKPSHVQRYTNALTLLTTAVNSREYRESQQIGPNESRANEETAGILPGTKTIQFSPDW